MIKFLRLMAAVILLAGCNNRDTNQSDTSTQKQPGGIAEPTMLTYSLLNAYPHDTAAFTQGLEIYKGKLYESNGLIGRSNLRKLDPSNGKILLSKSVDSPYFAEGITILNDTIYQLTYTSKVVFLYKANDLSMIGKVDWNGEGWGITNDGKNLYISDGSDKIYMVRPGDLKLQKVISVHDHTGPVNNINELEFINGHLYANRWQYDYILQISPSSGLVTGKMDLTDILKKNSKVDLAYLTAPGSTGFQNGGVLNGIAWDSATGKMLVTGKLWPYIFELKLNQ